MPPDIQHQKQVLRSSRWGSKNSHVWGWHYPLVCWQIKENKDTYTVSSYSLACFSNITQRYLYLPAHFKNSKLDQSNMFPKWFVQHLSNIILVIIIKRMFSSSILITFAKLWIVLVTVCVHACTCAHAHTHTHTHKHAHTNEHFLIQHYIYCLIMLRHLFIKG